jgi:tetratricopeptide (TPR) repeat protein
MPSSPRIDELRQKFHENPRRYFAPLANEYRKAGDPEQAIAICRAHLAQQPGHMSGHVVYGQALYDAGRMDEAAVVFHQALALDPENIIILRHLGDIARQRGDVDEARSWYSRALDGDPHDAEIAAYLAELTEPLTTAPQAQTEAPAQPQPESQAEMQAQAVAELPAEAVAEPPQAAQQGSQPEAQDEQQREAAEESQLAPHSEAHVEHEVETHPQPVWQAPSLDAAPAVSDMTGVGATDAVPETAAESAAVEEIALEGAESEGLAPEPPSASPEPEPPPASPEPEPTPRVEPEADFNEWPESAIEPEPVINFFDTEETHAPDELISPYAREMELAAPSEMKWDLNESPYLELVESSASDDAWDSVRTAPDESLQATNADSAEDADQPAPTMEARTDVPPAAEPSEAAADASAGVETAAPGPLGEAGSESPTQKTPSRTTPVAESGPIVTRTLAELYLQQGYIEPALEIYRQLAEQEPGDRGLQARIEEISTDAESIAAGEEEEEAAEMAAAEGSEEESTVPAVAPETTAGLDADATAEPESTPASAATDELWDSADSWGDWPFTDAEDRDEIFGLPDDVGAPPQEVAEPERVADVLAEAPEAEQRPSEPEPEVPADASREPETEPSSVPAAFVSRRVITVREFFATLGSARPPLRDLEQSPAPAEPVAAATEPDRPEEPSAPEEYPIADDAFANLFAGVPANAEDSRAAAALSGAVAHGAPFSTPMSPAASPPPRAAEQSRESGQPAQESEEDIRRFREWLDGLADS